MQQASGHQYQPRRPLSAKGSARAIEEHRVAFRRRMPDFAMLARDALRQSVKSHLVPLLRSEGFRGTYPTWRLERDGDVAIVNIAAAPYNEGSYGQFLLNLAVVPSSWWAWTHECAVGNPVWGSTSRPGRAHVWDALYGSLVTPSRSKEYWEVGSEAEADTVATAMAQALRTAGLPRLYALMGPGRMLEAYQAGAIEGETRLTGWPGGRNMVLAVLLSDVGGAELESVCHQLDAFAGREFPEMPLKTAAWARARGRPR